jgi:hypothetical protein
MTQTKGNARLASNLDVRKKHKAALAKILKVLRTVSRWDVDDLRECAKAALQTQVNRRNLIVTGTGPLNIPQRVGNGISRAVEDFAREENLDRELWYHDEPIWLLRSKRNDPYREVQIAAYSSERDERLFFIPQAYRLEAGTVKAASQKVVQPLIKSLPLSKLEASDEDGVAKDVGEFLPEAWSKAKSISDSDLEIVNRRR